MSWEQLPDSVKVSLVSVTSLLLAIIGGSTIFDTLIQRILDRWKQKKDLSSLYRKYSAPLFRSSHELSFRLFNIIYDSRGEFLAKTSFYTGSVERKSISRSDPYFLNYQSMSTLYRLCAFLGWIELYKKETTFLQPMNDRRTRSLELKISDILSDFADRTDGTATNWNTWYEKKRNTFVDPSTNSPPNWKSGNDFLIYREESRAIGESMIEIHQGERNIIGYARFIELLEQETINPTQKWSKVVIGFLEDFYFDPADLRYYRLVQLAIDLVDIAITIDRRAVDPRLIERQSEMRKRLTSP